MSKYKLVPIEPTQEMIDEGLTARTHPRERYKAMLAAAPTVEQAPEVAKLVETLEQCITSMLDSGYHTDAVVIQAARSALAVHHKQGGDL